ncbi:hypothetical protein TNCV_4793201 [Trichonephila clavipes]|nr:hypothetical protein TNCV_4793201 [Trichonephila clavipes]
MRRLASEFCSYTREKQEVAFDSLEAGSASPPLLSTIRLPSTRATPALVAKLVAKDDNLAFKMLNTTSGVTSLDFYVMIGFVARQHIFALNYKGVETFGKFVNVTKTSTSLKCHLYQQPEDGVDWAKEF